MPDVREKDYEDETNATSHGEHDGGQLVRRNERDAGSLDYRSCSESTRHGGDREGIQGR